MANNCLVEKLKSVVNNDNLEVLGSFKIIPTSSSAYFEVGFNDNLGNYETSHVKLTDCYVGDNITDFILPASSPARYNITITGENPCILFSNKYKLNSIKTDYINIALDNNIFIEENLSHFYVANGIVSGDITDIAAKLGSTNPGIDLRLGTSSSTITGDVSSLGSVYKFRNMYIQGLTGCTGDLSNLGYAAASGLEYIMFPSNKNISLEIVDLVKKARKNSIIRDSSGIALNSAVGINCTLNGIDISTLDLTKNTLKWSATEINVFGETIENSDVEP